MIRGTRIIEGIDADNYNEIIQTLKKVAWHYGYQEIILPALAEQEIFTNTAGKEILNQMWAFQDKGGRDVCLMPEATAFVADYYRPTLRNRKLPHRVFYVAKCYRYERPQAGRYREFTQFGFECLGPLQKQDNMVGIARDCCDALGITEKVTINDKAQRGLAYYVNNGFEIAAPELGTQQQICGGGEYTDGVGFAFGVDRLMLVKK